jgi:hypothetical protein
MIISLKNYDKIGEKRPFLEKKRRNSKKIRRRVASTA